MPSVSDFFRVRYMIEVGGVQTQTKQDYQVDSIDGADPINTVLTDLAQAYWDTLKAIMTTETILSCLAFYNWTSPEQAVVYPLLPGENIGESHPQFQIVRANLYGQTAGVPSDPIVRGATNVSGIAESLSTRGRINDLAEFDLWENFLQSSIQTSVTGWTITPHIRVLDKGVTPTWVAGLSVSPGDPIFDHRNNLFIATSGGITAGNDSDLAGGSDTGVSWDNNNAAKVYAFKPVVKAG
ncbi:MAG: hypothetical protein OEY63_02145, partial [Gemmatimonadota bacterium]|nr:hypothetical protein [Gemmatimonadota bacterium]